MSVPGAALAGWRRLAASRGLQATLCIVVLAALLTGGLTGDRSADRLAADFGWPGAALLVAAQGVIAVSPFPSQIVAVALGAAYGFWVGAALIWSGWMVTALLQYSLARRSADDIDLDAWIARTPRWVRRFPAGHPMFLILGRQVPLGPHVVNITAGAMRVPLSRHLFCSALGVVPQAVLMSGLAAGLFGAAG